jgi:hypothetical protein
VVYLYSEHYQDQGEPASHAQAIRAKGHWIIEVYRKLGLDLGPAENAVEAGITEVRNLLVRAD